MPSKGEISIDRQRILAIVGVALAAAFLFANTGFKDLLFRSHEKKRLESSLVHLQSEHMALAREWQEIREDPSFTEYLIRKNLGYVKKGEVEYQLIKPKEN